MLSSVLDTSEASQARYYELLRAQAPAERLAIAVRLTRSVRMLAEVTIRSERPAAPEAEVRSLMADRLYGRTIAERWFNRADYDDR
jgi:hypothetical protein